MKTYPRLYTKSDIKIDVHVCTHNEELMLPHFLNFYSQYTDRIFVHDQYSTDNTVNIAHQYGCIIDTYGSSVINDIDLLEQKHKAYYSSTTCDYVFIVDCDEFIIHNNLLGKLKWCKQNNILIPKSSGFSMYYDNFDFMNDDISDIKYGIVGDILNQKNCVIRANQNLKYHIGCHQLESPYQSNYIDIDPIKYCHMKYINYKYILDRHAYFYSRLSNINKKNGWGVQYSYSNDKLESEFNYLKNNSICIFNTNTRSNISISKIVNHSTDIIQSSRNRSINKTSKYIDTNKNNMDGFVKKFKKHRDR